jgi:signal transduction histidine kinase
MTTDRTDARRDLESLGQMAAGIADAFNNVATAVVGYADILMVRHGASLQDRGDLLEIQKAGRRGALLAEQLRVFSCASPPELVEVDLNQTVASVHQSLRGLVHEGISLTCQLGDLPAAACIDSRQVEQALLNLVLNAQETLVHGCVELEVSLQADASAGYRVLEAATASTAVSLFEAHGRDAAVIVSDVAIGEDSGLDLVRQLTAERPALRAVLMSGHGQLALSGVRAGEVAAVLSKPFTASTVVETVRRALEAHGNDEGGAE